MKLHKQIQSNPVSYEVEALVAIARPILLGLLQTIRAEKLSDHGGYAKIRLRQLAST